MRDDFCIFKAFFGVIREKLPQKLPHKWRKLKHTPASCNNKKALKLLKFKAFLCCRMLLKIGYGGGGGIEPRPKVLYKAFYILSCVYLKILFPSCRPTGLLETSYLKSYFLPSNPVGNQSM